MDSTQKKEQLIQAWKETLGVSAPGDGDNFFEAGGDSLKAAKLVSLLAQKGLKLDMLKLYTKPTIAELAEELEETQPIPAGAQAWNGNAPLMAAPAAQQIAAQPIDASQLMPGSQQMLIPMLVYVPVYMPQPMGGLQPMDAAAQAPLATQAPQAPQASQIPTLEFGSVTKSPEDALDAVLSGIFPNGYDKEVNLFEQGMDSLKMVQMVSGCAREGYKLEMQKIMEDPTFKGIVANMKAA